MSNTASLPTPLSEKSVTASAACPPTAASKAFPPESRMRRAASVASAFMVETAAWRPRMTGRMVWVGSSDCAGAGGTTEKTTRTANTSDNLCDNISRPRFRGIGVTATANLQPPNPISWLPTGMGYCQNFNLPYGPLAVDQNKRKLSQQKSASTV